MTVGLASDPGAIADKVQAMVTAANSAINMIQNQIHYDANTQTASPLTGDNLAVSLQNAITSALTGLVGTSSLVVAGSVGVDVDSSGDVSFDRAKFLSAYAANPSAVQALFVRSGASASPDVSFVDAGNFTRRAPTTSRSPRPRRRRRPPGSREPGRSRRRPSCG